ncbi:MAG: hypothetical protein QW650_00945 [Thermofilum sp.]
MGGWSNVTVVLRRCRKPSRQESGGREASSDLRRTQKQFTTKKSLWTDELADRAHFKGWSDEEIVKLRELCERLPEEIKLFSLMYRWVMGGLRIAQIEQLVTAHQTAQAQGA